MLLLLYSMHLHSVGGASAQECKAAADQGGFRRLRPGGICGRKLSAGRTGAAVQVMFVCMCVQVVAARGCAYVVMVHRSDATRARLGLKDIRIGGQHGKVGGGGMGCGRGSSRDKVVM